MPTALQCPTCNAPLPPAAGFAVCKYCHATVSVDGGAKAAEVEEAEPVPRQRDFLERVATATATFERVLRGNGTPEQAAWYAAHDFGAPGVDPGEVAHGAIGLARDFDEQNGTALARDATGMVRVIEAYANVALAVRRSAGRGSVNLPFLVKHLHYDREFTARSLAALVASARRGRA